MRIIVLFLAVLAAMVSACPKCSSQSHTSKDRTITPRWAEGVSAHGSYTQPWPPWTDGLHRIQYCYNSRFAEAGLQPHIHAALQLWVDAIGQPSQASGHRLIVEQHPLRYCWKVGNNDDVIWNPDVPDTTLHIYKTNMASAASATLGWTNGRLEELHGEPLWGRRHMKIGDATFDPAQDAGFVEATIAHEFGHVFGLYHEHQRVDRDKYVYFDCTAMLGYDEVKQRVEQAGQHTMDQVCNDLTLGDQYGFTYLKDFMKGGTHWEENNERFDEILTEGPAYDVNSIMHYTSFHTSQGIADPSRLGGFAAPLRKWKNGGPDFTPPQQATEENSEIIWTILRPSPGDAEAIRRLYPW